MTEFKSGFVSIIGRTNVGKSTLVNNLIGEKIAAITNKCQTTRTAIKGIVNTEDSQIIFIDTPGIHKPKTKLRRNYEWNCLGNYKRYRYNNFCNRCYIRKYWKGRPDDTRQN